MSLTGRFSALFLGVLGIVLVVFSTVLYVSARIYLDRRVSDRLGASLAVLAAAAEVHPGGVEWEPQERILPLGQESGPDRLRWIVFDDRGQRIDHSHNLSDTELSADWVPSPGGARLASRLVDRLGRSWQVAQRRLEAGAALPSGSHAAQGREEAPDQHPTEALYPALVLTVCVPLDAKESTLATLAWFLLALSVGIWIVASVLCRRLCRRALAPLARMVESARHLNPADPGWCLEQAGSGDELDDLGRAFNDLLSRLHAAYQQQRRFSSDVSHQLRTPLTILIGQIEVSLRQERCQEEYRRVLQSALGKATLLGQVVDALLFLGRSDFEAQLPDSERLDLGLWLAEYLADQPTSACASKVVYQHVNCEPLPVRVHPSLLGQLVLNLLDNACQYGEEGSSILVETLRDGDMAILAVEDVGLGIASDELARVFEPFYRSATGRRRSARGVGLGLAIVDRIASAFGGSVAVRSDLGVGSRFEVRLPICPAVHSLEGVAGQG
jgi:two-component system, OmpR family, sensor kinase